MVTDSFNNGISSFTMKNRLNLLLTLNIELCGMTKLTEASAKHQPSSSQSLSLHSHLSFLRLISQKLATRCLAVTGSGSIGKCGKGWLLGAL